MSMTMTAPGHGKSSFEFMRKRASNSACSARAFGTSRLAGSNDIRKCVPSRAIRPAGLPFKLHDFGARGVSSLESALLGGMAHLVNFQGSDTLAAVLGARVFYGEPMAAFSIPAAEHSTITAWGREGEVDAYRNMLKQYAKPGALLAVVSDSYDLEHAVRHLWGEQLREAVIASGATVLIRPDSGDPTTMVMKTVQSLASTFGTTVNAKGFRVLDHVRVIQGDGITLRTIRSILAALKVNGYSADNVAFGQGGALLQVVNRDDQRFAMKCSAVDVGGVWRDVFKDPVTDPGKRSKAGRLTLLLRQGDYLTVRLDDARHDALSRDGWQSSRGRSGCSSTSSPCRSTAAAACSSPRCCTPPTGSTP